MWLLVLLCAIVAVSSDVKVFGLGWSKTGTTSLHEALTTLGLRSVHTDRRLVQLAHKVARHEPIDLTGWFDHVDAVSDQPVPFFFKEVYQSYPHAKYVLTIRDPDDWFHSFERHGKTIAMRIQQGIRIDPAFDLIHRLGLGTMEKKAAIERYIAHNQRMVDFFADKPNQLLVIDVAKNASWAVLCDFLGLQSVPSAGDSDETNAEYDPEEDILRRPIGSGRRWCWPRRHNVTFPRGNKSGKRGLMILKQCPHVASVPSLDNHAQPSPSPPPTADASESHSTAPRRMAYVTLYVSADLSDRLYPVDGGAPASPFSVTQLYTAVVLIQRLRALSKRTQLDSSIDYVIMVLGALTVHQQHLLAALNIKVLSVGLIPCYPEKEPLLSFDADVARLKLRVWTMVEYSRVQFVDAQLMPLADLDPLFETDGLASPTLLVAMRGDMHGNSSADSEIPIDSRWFVATPNCTAWSEMYHTAHRGKWKPLTGWEEAGPLVAANGTRDWSFPYSSADRGLILHQFGRHNGIHFVPVGHIVGRFLFAFTPAKPPFAVSVENTHHSVPHNDRPNEEDSATDESDPAAEERFEQFVFDEWRKVYNCTLANVSFGTPPLPSTDTTLSTAHCAAQRHALRDSGQLHPLMPTLQELSRTALDGSEKRLHEVLHSLGWTLSEIWAVE